VDTETQSFTLKTRIGEEIAFKVNDHTNYRSRENQIQGLENITIEMVALVLSIETENGENLAVTIAAGDKDDLPKIDQRLLGKVIEISQSRFTLETRDGTQYIIQVNEDTIFRSLGKKVQGLENLDEGMLLMAGVQEEEGGEYLAKLVIIGRRPGQYTPQSTAEPGSI
jgi:hypothetical protein